MSPGNTVKDELERGECTSVHLSWEMVSNWMWITAATVAMEEKGKSEAAFRGNGVERLLMERIWLQVTETVNKDQLGLLDIQRQHTCWDRLEPVPPAPPPPDSFDQHDSICRPQPQGGTDIMAQCHHNHTRIYPQK